MTKHARIILTFEFSHQPVLQCIELYGKGGVTGKVLHAVGITGEIE